MLEEIDGRMSIEDVIEIVTKYLGSDYPIVDQIQKGILKFQTICHNPPGKGSYKLFYYHTTKLFRCYTECGESFNIYGLIMRSLNISFPEALMIVRDVVIGHPGKEGFQTSHSELGEGFYCPRDGQADIDKKTEPIGEHYLKIFKSKYKPIDWIREDINLETLKKYEIEMDFYGESIILPHRDKDGELLGIRGRNFGKWELGNKRAKYSPVVVSGRVLGHPLGGNLYGIHLNKDIIKNKQIAILFEGEKSVMKYESYFPNENISLAVCGSHISNPQISLLKKMGVKEVVIAFDKMFEKSSDEDAKRYRNKLIKAALKFPDEIEVSYIWDNLRLTSFKASPIDHGKRVFELLYKSRIKVKK